MRVQQPIFSTDPKGVPVLGLFTMANPATLGPGRYRRIENWRWDRAALRVREGTVRQTASAIAASGAWRGAWSGFLNGTAYEVVAYLTAGAVNIYSSTDFSTYSEVTASSGPYGNTRMSDAQCAMEAVRDPFSGRDVLLIGNGTDALRVYDPQGDDYSGDTVMAIHDTISPPSDTYESIATAQFPTGKNFNIAGTGVTPTHSNTAGEFEGANTDAGTDEQHITVTIFTLVDAGDTWTVNTGNTPNANSGAEFCMLVETTYAELMDHITVAFRRSGTGTFDDVFTAGGQFRTVTFDAANDRFFIIFPFVLSGSQNWDRMRWTWVGFPPATDQTVKVYLLSFSGNIPGATEFGLTYSSNAGRSESYGRVCRNAGRSIQAMNGTSLNGARLPLTDELNVSFSITAKAPSSAGSTDRIKLYMKQTDSFTFQYVASNFSSTADVFYLSSWSGAAWADETSGGGFHGMTGGTNGLVITNPLITMPDGEHSVIPKAKYLLAANDRLFSGNVSGAPSEVWVSKDKVPWHNRRNTIFITSTVPDGRSPTSIACETEAIQGFAAAPSSSPTNPENTVYIFGNKHVWSLSGELALGARRREADIGTLSPRSITTYRRAILFLDTDRQVRILEDGQLVSLSRDSTDDKWRDIPNGRVDDVNFKVFRERLYIGYSSSGASTNDRLAGFSFFLKAWEFDEPLTSPCTAEGLLIREDTTVNRQRLMAFASDAKIYEIEQYGATQDNVSGVAANISTRLTPGDLVGDGTWKSIYVRNIGVLIDDMASGTLSLTVTDPVSGQVQTFTSLSIDVSTSQAYRWFDVLCSFSDDSLNTIGPRKSIDLQGSLLGGKNLNAVLVEVDKYDKPYADSA